MAKQTLGINGPFIGRLGDKIGFLRYGMPFVRSLTKTFHDAKSPLQLVERGRFGSSMTFAARMRDALRVGLNVSATKLQMTEYNRFYQINNRCLSWKDEALSVDYEHLHLSDGPVAPVAFTNVERGMRWGEFVVDFEKNPEHRNCDGNDKVYVVAICADRFEAELSLPVYRRMKRITVSLPTSWVGCEVHLYGFVQDNANRASQTLYIGGGTIENLSVKTGGGHDVVLVDELEGKEGGGFVQQKPEEDFITFPEGNRGVADTREHGKVGFLNPG